MIIAQLDVFYSLKQPKHWIFMLYDLWIIWLQSQGRNTQTCLFCSYVKRCIKKNHMTLMCQRATLEAVDYNRFVS